jgi:hypothetical protein
MVSGLTGEAVAVLCKHHRHSSARDEITHLVETRALEARPTLAGILDLRRDLVALPGAVLAQRLKLLGQLNPFSACSAVLTLQYKTARLGP